MDFMYTVVEAVVISFLVGAVMGGIVAVHLQTRSERREELKLQKVKVKADRGDYR
jgi:uncharacterized membrane-anchored protein YhcB (DUF1043 family)